MFKDTSSLSGSTFHNPTKLVFGKGAATEMGKELKARGFSKPLLICGRGSIHKNGSYDQTVGSIKEAGIEIAGEISGVRANPELSSARAGIARAKEVEADCVVAIGGGSVIDASKAVCAGRYVDDVWTLYKSVEWGAVEKALPLFVVLTISATGSEMNCGSVLQNDEDQAKLVLQNPLLYPVVSCIDPMHQTTLPWWQTVNGVVDAMVHTMEFYTNYTQKEEAAICIDEGLLRALKVCGDGLKGNEKDYDLRANVAWAATLALNGISGFSLHGGSWLCHFIEHVLSGIDPTVSHGAGLGVLMPACIEFFVKNNNMGAVFDRWAKNVFNVEGWAAGCAAWREMLTNWGHPTTMEEIGFTRDAAPKIAAMMAAYPLGVPHNLTEAQLQDLVMLAYK